MAILDSATLADLNAKLDPLDHRLMITDAGHLAVYRVERGKGCGGYDKLVRLRVGDRMPIKVATLLAAVTR
jgi:hypothetical protein